MSKSHAHVQCHLHPCEHLEMMHTPPHSLPAEDDGAIAADQAEAAATRPTRQSSAIYFNAALGGWGGVPAVPTRPSSARPLHAAAAVPTAVKVAQGAAVQPHISASTQVTSQKMGQIAAVSVSGSQQDLRPRSSDGILQRITVDRGPATGTMHMCL